MDKQTVVYPCNEILYNNQKEGTTDSCNKVEETQMHYYVEQKKSDTKGYVLYNTMRGTFWKRKSIGTGNRLIIARSWPWRKGFITRGTREWKADGTVLNFYCG